MKWQWKKFLSLLEIISGFKISINWSILFSSLKGIYFIWDNNVKGQGIYQIIFHTVSLEKKKIFWDHFSLLTCVRKYYWFDRVTTTICKCSCEIMKIVDIQPSHPNTLEGFQGKFLNTRSKLSEKSIITTTRLN